MHTKSFVRGASLGLLSLGLFLMMATLPAQAKTTIKLAHVCTEITMEKVSRTVIPVVLIMIVDLLVVSFVPVFTTFIPGLFFK